MGKLTAKKTGSDKNPLTAKAMAELLKGDDFLGPNVKNGRVDLDKRIHNRMKSLGTATVTNDNKTVTMRMLMTEFIIDGFKKYEAKEGKYEFDEDEMKSWIANKL